jgi:NUMOD1 domain
MSDFKKGITPTISIAASNQACSFQLVNIKTKELNILSSIRKAANYLNCHYSSLKKTKKSLKNKNLYKKTYRITKNNKKIPPGWQLFPIWLI